MKHIAFLTIIIITIFSFIPASAQKIAYPPKPLLWKADSLGTHRAVIHVSGNQPIAKGTIIWRRRDSNLDKKMMILVDSLTGEQVKNVKFDDVNRISCTLYFQTNGNHDTYFLYYMPYRHKGSPYYPKDYYPDFVTTAAADWLRDLEGTSDFAAATLDKIEAVDSFNSFYPMEEIASRHETDSLVNAHPEKKYLVFPEDRMHIIKMGRDLPYRWIQKGVQHQFADQALKEENFAFQLGVYAAKTNLENVTLEFSDAKNGQSVLPASLFTCINTDGIDYKGNKARYRVNIPEGKIRSLWTYIPVPDDAQPGIYKGTIKVKAQNAPSTSIDFQLEVLNDVAANNGVDEPWKMTRLPWLNSTIGQENTVIPPYTPIRVNGDKISILGRQIELQPNGLPAQIQTFFPIEMTSISSKPTQSILSSPIEFRISDHQKRPVSFKSQDKSYTLRSDGTLEWTAHNQSGDLTLEVDGHLEFDGFLSYTVRVMYPPDQVHIVYE